jgi:hypothetical protein
MKRQSLRPIRGNHRGRPGRPSPDAGQLQDRLDELEEIFGELQDAMRAGTDESRLKLAAIRRKISERLDIMFQEIEPAIVESEFRQPGIVEQFYAVWLDRPDVRQGETSWLRFLGNVRQLLLRALGADRGTVRAAHAAGDSRQETPSVTTGRSEPEFLTPQQVAARYGVDAKTVRRKLRNHPDVRHVGTAAKRGHRPGRDHLRIPAGLADRLFRIGSQGA